MAITNISQCTPLVSVVIPIFNRSNLIENTLDSVFAQAYRPIELILVDDGSTDDSYAKATKWRDSIRVSSDDKFLVNIIRQQNAGAPTARNAGIKISTGSYLQFLDSDDLLDPQKISSQIPHLTETMHDIAVCDFKYVTEQLDTIRISYNSGNLAMRMALGWSIYTSTPLFCKRFIMETKCLWDEKLKINQDIDYNLRAILLTSNVIYTPGIWCSYVQHGGFQISDNHDKRAPQYIRRIRNLINLTHFGNHQLPKSNQKYIYVSMAILAKDLIKFYIYKMPRNYLKLALILTGFYRPKPTWPNKS